MKELVTILLPTYNGQKYIIQMLQSIFLQTYRPIEVIISDDASEDNTVLIIERYLSNNIASHIQFKLIKNIKNRGVSGNISKAVAYVHGKYLFLADQDDMWEKDKVSAQIEYLEKNQDCVMCICDRCVINKNNEIVCSSLFKYKCSDIRKRDYRKVLTSVKLYPANCMCLRTKYLKSIFPVPAQIYEHDTFIVIMAAHYGKIGYINKVLTLYRIHGGNLSRQYALETNRNLLKAAYVICKGYRRKNRKEVIDPVIVKRELKRRYSEEVSQWSKNIYPGKTKHVYLATIQYILKNIERWQKFC